MREIDCEAFKGSYLEGHDEVGRLALVHRKAEDKASELWPKARDGVEQGTSHPSHVVQSTPTSSPAPAPLVCPHHLSPGCVCAPGKNPSFTRLAVYSFLTVNSWVG